MKWMAFLHHGFRYALVHNVQPKVSTIDQRLISLFQTTNRISARDDKPMGSINRTRNKITLRGNSLICLNICLAAACIGLALAWHFSEVLDGYEFNGANQYLLAYGPTAIFICIVAFWRQVDFHTKAVVPWFELHSGHTTGSKSLILDYISPLQVTALWQSVRNGHVPVTLTILGFLLLKLATLFSTGLLVVNAISFKNSTTGIINSQFQSEVLSINNYISTSDQALFYTTYGVLVEDLEKPFGVGDGLAFPLYSLPPQLPNSFEIQTELNVFVPTFDCKAAQVSVVEIVQNSTEENPDTELEILSPSCYPLPSTTSFYRLNPKTNRCPDRQLSGIMTTVGCDASVFSRPENTSDIYQLITLADMRYEQQLNASDLEARLSEPVDAISWRSTLHGMTSVICRMSYEVLTAPVVVNSTSAKQPAISLHQASSPAARLNNLTDENLNLLFRAALSSGDGAFGSRTDESFALEYPDPLIKLMAKLAGGQYSQLLDSGEMQTSASRAATQLIAQIAHQYLRNSTSVPVDMTVTTSKMRLHVTTLAAWVILSSLIVMFLLNAVLWNYLRRYKPMDFGAGLNRISKPSLFSRSTEAQMLASQSWTEADLRKAFDKVDVMLVAQSDQPAMVVLGSDLHQPVSSGRDMHWWSPMTISGPVLGCTFALAIAAIIVLEILQRSSDTHSGFVQLSSTITPESETIYLHVIPALTVLGIASLFNCLDFNTLLLTPFAALKTSVSGRRLQARPLLSHTPILALWSACRTRSWGAILSSSVAMIGSLMTIVVSGLYSAEIVSSEGHVRMLPLDTLRPVWNSSATRDNGAALISSLTENLQFPYPIGTFEGLLLPTFEIVNNSISQNASFSATVPTWRAQMACERMTGQSINISTSENQIQKTVTINATYPLPSTCLFGGQDGNGSTLGFINTFNYPLGTNSTYLGKLLNLHVGPFSSITESSQGEASPVTLSDNPPGCPSLAFIYGYFDQIDFNTTGSTDSIVVEVCYQQIQQLSANVTFTNSSLNVDANTRPLIDESSTEFLIFADNKTTLNADLEAATAFPFRLQNHFENTFAIFNTTGNNPFSNLGQGGAPVDSFFQGVMFGRNDIPVTMLRLASQKDFDIVKSGVVTFYQRYMAQVMNLNMRARLSTTNGGDGTILEATSPDGRFHHRVVQHNTSKIVLQSMLAFMIAGGAITLLTTTLHRLLPATSNPCTIWGQMSLWAGSTYLESLRQEDRGSSDDKQAQTSSMSACLSEERFKLDWWYTHNKARRYGIDVISEA